MSEIRVTRTVVVTDPAGVHARTAVAIAETVRRGKSTGDVDQGRTAGRRRPMCWQIMTLVADRARRLTVEAAGPDAAAVLDALEPLFAGRFGDEAKKPE